MSRNVIRLALLMLCLFVTGCQCGRKTDSQAAPADSTGYSHELGAF